MSTSCSSLMEVLYIVVYIYVICYMHMSSCNAMYHILGGWDLVESKVANPIINIYLGWYLPISVRLYCALVQITCT